MRGAIHHPRLVSALAIALSLQAGAAAAGGIATDGTVGPRTRLNGPDYVIGADLGSTRGANLFHSFQGFSIDAQESATFTGPDSIQRVISRVTGGEASNIDGLLRSKVGSADFYFINPAGVVIGPNARIDVPAALHVGTAHEVRMADGQTFSAVDPAASTLTSAAPEAFGFLGGPTGDLRVEGVVDGWYDTPDGTRDKAGWHRVKKGAAVTLAASNVTLDQQAWVDAPGGRVTVVATGDAAGSVGLGSGPGAIDIRANGTLVLDHNSGFDTTDYSQTTGDGRITVRAGRGELYNRSFLYADNKSPKTATGGVEWHSDSLLLDDAYVSAEVFGNGAGGDVTLWVDGAFEIRNNSVVSTWSQSNGSAGDVTLRAGTLTLDGASIWSDAYLEGQTELELTGNAGDVRITVDGMLTLSNASILSNTWSRGQGGTVEIHAADMNVEGSRLATVTRGFGDAGSVRVTVEGTLTLAGSTLESSTWNGGNGGALEVRAGTFHMVDSTLNADSQWNDKWIAGDAGSILVDVDGAFDLTRSVIQSLTAAEGVGGTIDLRAGTMSLAEQSKLDTDAAFTGDAGAILIDVTGMLKIADSEANSSTKGSGQAGSIRVSAGGLEMQGASLITESTADDNDLSDYQGNAGRVEMRITGDAAIDGGKVSSSTYTRGDAGGVELRVDGRLDLGGSAWVVSDSWSTGSGGNVQVAAQEMGLSSGALITADSLSTGPGGNVAVEITGALALAGGAYIASDAYAAGPGGSVEVTAGSLHMEEGGGIYSEVMNDGNAGSVRVQVDGPAELFSGAVITTRSREYTAGQPGDVNFHSASLLVSGGASINSDTKGFGHGGRVDVGVDGPITLQDGGRISTSSGGYTWWDGTLVFNTGNAGRVGVESARLLIDGQGNPDTGVLSKVYEGSYGEVGDVDIQSASTILRNGGRVSIENLNPYSLPGASFHAITLTGQELTLDDGGLVTSESRGAAAAGAIVLHLAQSLEMRDSAITTQAVDGDGGAILIDPWLIRLTDSLITTSVTGTAGNGGDITLAADNLILNGGFIQANTAAAGAHGGEINIAVNALIPFAGELSVGDLERQTFQPGRNVIQAAAPDGINGEIRITSPELDVTSGLITLDTGYMPAIDLYQGPCGAAAGGSGLAWAGRGGLPWRAGEPYSLPLSPDRLGRILGAGHDDDADGADDDAPADVPQAGFDCRFEANGGPVREL